MRSHRDRLPDYADENVNTLNRINSYNVPYKIDRRNNNSSYPKEEEMLAKPAPPLVKARSQTSDLKEPTFDIVLKRQLSEELSSSYDDELLQNLRRVMTTPADFLTKHDISVGLRAKMVDWMIEVLSSYKMYDDSFFKAVYYMDRFLEKAKRKHESSELHLLGITCMFMATKFEEIYGFKLEVLFEKVGHRRVSKESILRKETEVVEALDFQLERPTFYCLVKHAQYRLSSLLSEQSQEYLQKVVLYLSKMSLHHYELLMRLSYSELAAGCVYVGLKTLQQMERGFQADYYIKDLTQITGVPSEEIMLAGSKILALAKNFSKLYPKLENLKKFNGLCMNKYE